MRQESFNHPDLQGGGTDRPVAGLLKVPFGLKGGRMWSPRQVAAGLACGCVCPACQSPLIAKAADSSSRRPHFAHFADSNCRAGYETALHKKAKELLAEHGALVLPGWDGEERMPNPPTLVDDEGCWIAGRRVEMPARQVRLTEVRTEERQGDYTPDVLAQDAQGELLIEIRVSHAVDALKRQRIQSEGRRLVEIDLSKLHADVVQDEDQLKHWVLAELSNRYWLACPEATEAWREALRELKQQIVERNQAIARKRQEQAEARRVQEHAKGQVRLQEAERRAQKERFREQERARYENELEELPTLVSVEGVQSRLEEYEARDQSEADRLITALWCRATQQALRVCGPNAWIYTVHPSLWQAASYHRFVRDQALGPQFNQRDVARWVMREFGRDEVLSTLFRAQYDFRSRARAAGIRKRRISFWAFTELENQQIPDFYKPIGAFVERLIYAGAIKRVEGVLGQVEIMPAHCK